MTQMKKLPVDHILYGVPYLGWGINHIHDLMGAKPIIGGKHPGYGTHNALLGLGEIAYLEIIAPDPDQKVDAVWMNLDQLTKPKLFRWAAYSNDLTSTKRLCSKQGIDIGQIKAGSRKTPAGELLQWELTDPNLVLGDGLIPFFIDWGENGNPTPTLPKGCRLINLKSTHPNPAPLRLLLQRININMDVVESDEIRLIAQIQTPKGLIELT